MNKEFGRDYGDEVVTRVGEVLSEYFHNGNVYRMTGDEYLVLVENASYEDFTQQVHSAYTKLENISLGLVSVGYAWGKCRHRCEWSCDQCREYDAGREKEVL